MMTLALMKRFYDTVTSEERSPIADPDRCSLVQERRNRVCLRASANFVFRTRAADRDFYLRFNHASERDVGLLEAECRF